MKLLRAIFLLLCRLGLVLFLGLGTAPAQQSSAGGAAGAATPELRHARLYGVAAGTIFKDVNRNDARAALKVWYELLGQQRGFLLDTKVDIVDSVAEIRERLVNGSADLVSLAVNDYLELESDHLLAPILTEARSGQAGGPYSYVLLVNPSSAATTMVALRGKNLLVSSRSGSNTATVWMDVLLGKEKLGRAASFFASVKQSDKAQSCILPLFFGAVDACVVDEVNLNMAKEMNPQLEKLRVLARSRPTIESIIALPSDPRLYQKDLVDAMLALHQSPRGRQLLMVFKTERLVRIQPGDLDGARELWRDYSHLPAAPPNQPPVSAAHITQSDRAKERP